MAALRHRRAPELVLLAALALSALAILYWGRGATFYADDWNYIVDRRSWSLHTLLLPSNGHLILLPLVLFKTLLAIFGATSALPFRLTVLSFDLLNGVLLYLLVRRRLGPWLALAPAVLLLFLGAGWEEIFEAFTLNALISIAAGLGMLLCLDRRDTAGDVGACALLAVSLASFSLGVVFAVICAAELIQRPGRGLHRAWVYLGPALLFGIWLIWAAKYDQNQLAATNIGPTPSAVFDGASAVAASIFGLFRSPGPEAAGSPDLGIRPDLGVPIALAVGVLLAWRLRSGPRPTPRSWGLLVGLLALWTLLALTIGPARSPLASRYVYPGVVLALLLAAELLAGVRLSRGWGIAVAAALAISLVANVDTMREGGGYFRAESSYNRAELAALEIARDRVPPEFGVEEASSELLPHGDLFFSAGNYFDAIDEFGSPAYSPGELADAGPEQRTAADQLLGRALGLSAQPAPVRPQPAPVTIAATKTFQMIASRRGRCTLLRPAIGLRGRAVLLLPPGGLYYRAPRDAQVSVSLGRFGNGFALKLPSVLGSGQVRIPGDESARPWRALLSSSVPVTACPV